MSTNYYIRCAGLDRHDMDPLVHIGKRSSKRFHWAMTGREQLRERVKEWDGCCATCRQKITDGKPIEDEYGKPYSLEQFEAEILNELEERFENVGHLFY